MDIKEIALKHAREYLTFKLGGRKGLDVEEIVCDDEIYKEIVNELAQQFEAIIAEIAKQNDPVARVNGYYGGHPVIMPLVKYVFPVGLALYTFPPTRRIARNARV